MDQVREVLAAFRAGTRAAAGKRTIACLKRGLMRLGVIGSDRVAPGTPSLAGPDAERFDRVFEGVRADALARLGNSASTLPASLAPAVRRQA